MRTLTCVVFLMVALSAVAADVPSNDRWLKQLDTFVAAHPELTGEQLAVVVEGRELLRSGILEELRSTDSQVAETARLSMRSFELRAARSFSPALYKEGFLRLDKKSRRSNGVQLVGPQPDCYCNPNYDECGGGECYRPGCLVTPDGCGTWGGDICTGYC